MKTKMKLLAIAVTLAAIGGTANAAIDPDPTAGGTGGEIFVSILKNTTSPQSLLIDTGLHTDTFLSNALSTSPYTWSADSATQALIGSFLGTSAITDFQFNAGGNRKITGVGNGLLLTNSSNPTAIIPTNSSMNTAQTKISSFLGTANNGSTDYGTNANLGPLNPTDFGFHNDPNWGNNDGGAVGFDTAGIVGTALDFYDYHVLSATTATQNLLGSFMLKADGSLMFTNVAGEAAPVPLPPAVWLLGSALVGMVGVARRKKTEESPEGLAA